MLYDVLHLTFLLLFRLDIVAECFVKGGELLFVEATQCLAQSFVVNGYLLVDLIRICAGSINLVDVDVHLRNEVVEKYQIARVLWCLCGCSLLSVVSAVCGGSHRSGNAIGGVSVLSRIVVSDQRGVSVVSLLGRLAASTEKQYGGNDHEYGNGNYQSHHLLACSRR